MIKGIVFDFDGLIIDTEKPEYETWREIYREHGGELPLETWVQFIGGTSDPFDPVGHLQEQIGRRLDGEELRARRRRRYIKLVEAQPIRPGVKEYLEEAESMGLRVGLASSSSREWVMGNLERLGLTRYFSSFSTRDDVERVKPDPTLYLRTVEALGIDPAQALALEDSRNGLLAAKNAGLYCVVVPCELTRGLDFGPADLVLDSLADIKLPALLRRIESTVA